MKENLDNLPPLKLQWERRDAIVEIDSDHISTLLAPYTSKTVSNFSLLSNGCANTNYKIEFTQSDPVVLRIYTREKQALTKEAATYQLLKNCIPVPEVLYSDKSCQLLEYPYALISWMDGQLMRDVILQGDENAIRTSSFSAGQCLAEMQTIQFSKMGFFNESLEVKGFASDEEYLAFVRATLQDDAVVSLLNTPLIESLSGIFNRYEDLFDIPLQATLSHSDYDPSNILVKEVKGEYVVSAVLDWEFVFSGSYFIDVGSFLRYSHKLPKAYEQAFIEGLCATGQELPDYWKTLALLMDAISMLSVLKRTARIHRPNLNRDIKTLLQHTVNYLVR